jgi:hypothetical protein
MSQEMLYFGIAQGLLGLLVLISMRWTSDIRKDINRIVEGLVHVSKKVDVSENRITNVERDTTHYHAVTDSRLERVGARVSDLGNDMERLSATISVCPSCPQPGQQRRRTAEEGAGE